MHLAGGTKNTMQRLRIINGTVKIQIRHLHIEVHCYYYTNLFDLKVLQVALKRTLSPEIANDTL